MNGLFLYKLFRPLLAFYIKLYKPEIINSSVIPKTGKCLLVGNHTDYLDALLVGVSTKRYVCFLAKDELMKGVKRPIFKNMGIIPVNRKTKDHHALEEAIKALNEGNIIGIFPEGTINRTDDIIMPFKYGAVKMASETNCLVVPFGITNKYKFLKKSVKIKFGTPYTIKDSDLEKENKKLMVKVTNLIAKD